MPRNKKKRSARKAKLPSPAVRKYPNAKGEESHLRCKHQYYTYSRCPLLPQFVVSKITDKYNVDKYFVCLEAHSAPSYVPGEGERGQDQREVSILRDDEEEQKAVVEPNHLHCYFRFLDKQYTMYKDLDLVCPDTSKLYHGNYQSCRDPARVIAYCAKDAVYVTNFSKDELAGLLQRAQRLKLSWSVVVETAKEGRLTQAFEQVLTVAPRDVVMKGPLAIKSSLRALCGAPEDKGIPQHWKWNEPALIAEWDRTKYALVLIGDTKKGKTNYARMLLGAQDPEAKKQPFRLQRLDHLKVYNADVYSGLVFDDVYLGNRSAELQLHITGVQDAADINVKYDCARIPAGTPRIFCHNRWPFSADVPAELARRLFVVKVEDDLRDMTDLPPEEQAKDCKPQDDLQQVMNELLHQDALSFMEE